jgi:hypothetical protein
MKMSIVLCWCWKYEVSEYKATGVAADSSVLHHTLGGSFLFAPEVWLPRQLWSCTMSVDVVCALQDSHLMGLVMHHLGYVLSQLFSKHLGTLHAL